MNYKVFSGGTGFSRSGELEDIYECMSYKAQITAHIKTLTEEQVDNILLSENVDPIQEEVIEELFGKTRAKIAGAGAKLGAQASNLKNRVATGASNVGQKAKAVAGNVANVAKQGVNAVSGQYQSGDLAAGQTDVSQVGTDVAQQTDPQQAANAAKLQAMVPHIHKTLQKAQAALSADLQAIGLTPEALNQLDPEIGKAIKYSQGWLKAALTRLGG